MKLNRSIILFLIWCTSLQIGAQEQKMDETETVVFKKAVNEVAKKSKHSAMILHSSSTWIFCPKTLKLPAKCFLKNPICCCGNM